MVWVLSVSIRIPHNLVSLVHQSNSSRRSVKMPHHFDAAFY
jgi:hypothetical protein